jgi:hypothetical protein
MSDWTDLLSGESGSALTSVTALVGVGISADAG